MATRKKDAVKIHVRFRPAPANDVESNQFQIINREIIKVRKHVDSEVTSPTVKRRAKSRTPTHRRPSSRATVMRRSSSSVPPTKKNDRGESRTPTHRRPSSRATVMRRSSSSVPPTKKNDRGEYKFDSVFPRTVTNQEVYDDVVKPIIPSLFEGFNCTIIAYGQTGSGKTHTMTGSSKNKGMIPLALDEIFTRAQKNVGLGWSTKIKIACVQIYMEKILDSLVKTNVETDPSLKLRQRFVDGSTDVFIEDLTWKDAKTTNHAIAIMKLADKNRVVDSTNMNAQSSRSHSVFMVHIEQTHVENSQRLISAAYLVDLAGSESVRKTGNTGHKLKQACHVNKSLSMLNTVIKALSTKSVHIPYRDSKLTRLLQNSLGGSSMTVMILTCSSCASNVVETVSTLEFGSRCKTIKNTPKKNQILSVGDYKKMLENAQSLLEKQKDVMTCMERENRQLKTDLKIANDDRVRMEIYMDTDSEVDTDGEYKEEVPVQNIMDPQKAQDAIRRIKSYCNKPLVSKDSDTISPTTKRGVSPITKRVASPSTPNPLIQNTTDYDADGEDYRNTMMLFEVSEESESITNSDRYFSSAGSEALRDEMVQLLERRVETLGRQNVDAQNKNDDMYDRMIEMSAKIHEQPLDVQVQPKLETDVEEERSTDAACDNDEMTTIRIILLSVGALILIALLFVTIMFAKKKKLGAIFWSLWSFTFISGAMIGLGIPGI